MALIIAIVLILIITIKVGNEKQVSHKTDVLIASNLAKDKNFKLLASDEGLEFKIKEKLNDPCRCKEVMSELNEVFSQLPTYIDPTTFCYYPRNKHSIEYSMALRILMAKHGKVPVQECMISGSGFYKTMYLPGQVSSKSREARKYFKHLMTWVEKELIKHGLPVRLIVVVGPDEINSLTEKFAIRGMDFYWDDYKNFADPEALTDNIYGFRWSLK